MNSFKVMQEEYQEELERMDRELQAEKNQWVQMS